MVRWIALASLLAAVTVAVYLYSTAEQPAPTSEAAAGTSATSAGIDWFDGSVDEAFTWARDSGRPLLLYWGATWCPPCNEIKATVFTRPDFIARTRELIPIYLDGDTPGAQKWGEHFGAMGYPTLILFAPDGRELTRITSGMAPARYAEVVANATRGGHSVSELLAAARRDPAALDDSDWQLLAHYGWAADQGRVLGDEPRAEVLSELAAACPATLEPLKTRFELLALLARSADDGALPQAAQARGRTLLTRVLEDPALRDDNLVDLAYAGADLVNAATIDTPEQRREHAEALRRAMDAAFDSQTLPLKHRLLTLKPQIELWRRMDTPPPPALQAKVRQRVDLIDAAAKTPHQRQSMLFIAGGFLQDVGLHDEARTLYLAELERSVAPHYYMSYLAALERELGHGDAALDWSRRAWETATGPATRLQWGVQYVEALLDLAPERDETIASTTAALIDALKAQPDAYYQRSRVRMQRLGQRLDQWAAEHDRQDRLASLRQRMAPLCPEGGGGNPLCEEHPAG